MERQRNCLPRKKKSIGEMRSNNVTGFSGRPAEAPHLFPCYEYQRASPEIARCQLDATPTDIYRACFLFTRSQLPVRLQSCGSLYPRSPPGASYRPAGTLHRPAVASTPSISCWSHQWRPCSASGRQPARPCLSALFCLFSPDCHSFLVCKPEFAGPSFFWPELLKYMYLECWLNLRIAEEQAT